MITVEEDLFICFAWDGSKLFKALKKWCTSSLKKTERLTAIGVQPDDINGDFSVIELDSVTMVLQAGETKSGNLKVTQDHVQTELK